MKLWKDLASCTAGTLPPPCAYASHLLQEEERNKKGVRERERTSLGYKHVSLFESSTFQPDQPENALLNPRRSRPSMLAGLVIAN
jgi:hypothetical protein